MAEPTPEEWAVLRREQRAFATGDRDAWLASVDPAFALEMLPDWPGPSRVDGAEAAWDAYVDFFGQFDNANYQYLNVEKQGDLTVCDVHSALAGLGSGVPGELLWTMVVEFDAATQRHTRVRWFHTREEAAAWAAMQPSTNGRPAPLAMSQENVEIVRRGFEAWNAGDMAAFAELVAPDAIIRTPPNWPEPGPYVGREATMRFYEGIREAWDVDTAEWVGQPVVAADRVVITFTWEGTGMGPEAKMELTTIYTVRNGLVRDMDHFWDRAEALEAIGLRE